MKKLSLEPYKGTRDFYPEDMFVQDYIFGVMRMVVESYGYQEYDASILEDTELYRAKTGEEIVNEQTYSFKDRGGRDVTIRPEITPTVARMVARKRKELAFPLRWYSIPNLLRYERPQRGRLREHWQLNVDAFGIDGMEAEKEMITIAYDIMRAFGVDDKKFVIKINSRKLVNYFLNDYLKLNKKQSYDVSKLIDKKNKMKEKEFRGAMESVVAKKDKVKKIVKFLRAGEVEEVGWVVKRVKKVEKGKNGKRGDETDGIEKVKEVVGGLKKLGIKNVVFDPTLMRGFDYYTGIVFEVFDANPKNNRSLFGGGRYDDLVGIFDVEKVSAVGFGMGDVTMKDVLETYKLLPEYESVADLYICLLSSEYANFAHDLSGDLRKQGLNVAVDFTGRKIGAQIKTADRQKIPFVLCVGEDEVKSGKFKVKNLGSGEEKVADQAGIVRIIR